MIGDQEITTALCARCGTTYYVNVKGRRRKYCSDRCKATTWAAKQRNDARLYWTKSLIAQVIRTAGRDGLDAEQLPYLDAIDRCLSRIIELQAAKNHCIVEPLS